MKPRELCILLGVLLASTLISFFAGKNRGMKQMEKWYKDNMDTTSVVQIDTNKADAPIPDTVYQDKPVYYPVYIDSEIPEPQIIYRDSIQYILMEKTIKEYKKENYYAKISGVDPNLDYIETYNTTITNTVYVPQKVEPKRNFIQLSGEFVYDKTPMLPVTLDLGYRKGLFEITAGGGYDFMQRGIVLKSGIKVKFEF